MTAIAIFLVVSIVSFAVQFWTWTRIHHAKPTPAPGDHLVRRACLRTVAFRWFAAALYIFVGLWSWRSPTTSTTVTLVVYTFVQILWWFNSALDMRLRSAIAQLQGRRD